MKTAIVLGATGLVGRTLVNILLQDRRYAEVTCLVRKPLSAQMFNDPHKRLKPLLSTLMICRIIRGISV